jgi:hypothetical protein
MRPRSEEHNPGTPHLPPGGFNTSWPAGCACSRTRDPPTPLPERQDRARARPGMGFFTVEIARQVGPSGRVVAVDVQPRRIAGLKRRLAKPGLLERIAPRLASSDSLGLQDLKARVDLALAIGGGARNAQRQTFLCASCRNHETGRNPSAGRTLRPRKGKERSIRSRTAACGRGRSRTDGSSRNSPQPDRIAEQSSGARSFSEIPPSPA